jgi:hypothetical protein
MAETLSVTDMLPNKFEPKRKFRWVFAIEGIDSFLMKTAARPSFTTSEQEIPFINSHRYLAGKTKFETLSVTLNLFPVAVDMLISTREIASLSFWILLVQWSSFGTSKVAS